MPTKFAEDISNILDKIDSFGNVLQTSKGSIEDVGRKVLDALKVGGLTLPRELLEERLRVVLEDPTVVLELQAPSVVRVTTRVTYYSVTADVTMSLDIRELVVSEKIAYIVYKVVAGGNTMVGIDTLSRIAVALLLIVADLWGGRDAFMADALASNLAARQRTDGSWKVDLWRDYPSMRPYLDAQILGTPVWSLVNIDGFSCTEEAVKLPVVTNRVRTATDSGGRKPTPVTTPQLKATIGATASASAMTPAQYLAASDAQATMAASHRRNAAQEAAKGTSVSLANARGLLQMAAIEDSQAVQYRLFSKGLTKEAGWLANIVAMPSNASLAVLADCRDAMGKIKAATVGKVDAKYDAMVAQAEASLVAAEQAAIAMAQGTVNDAKAAMQEAVVQAGKSAGEKTAGWLMPVAAVIALAAGVALIL